MAELKLALPTIFLHEGRYVNNKNDPGGATNYGISLRFLLKTGDLDKDGWLDGDIDHDGDVDIDDINKMSEENSARLYELYFWNKYGYERINDQAIATKVFSLSINMGIGAHKCLQRAVRAASGIILDEDGVLGLQSMRAINLVSSLTLLSALKSEAAGYYRSIKFKDPNQDANKFLKGWLNRAYGDMILSIGRV